MPVVPPLPEALVPPVATPPPDECAPPLPRFPPDKFMPPVAVALVPAVPPCPAIPPVDVAPPFSVDGEFAVPLEHATTRANHKLSPNSIVVSAFKNCASLMAGFGKQPPCHEKIVLEARKDETMAQHRLRKLIQSWLVWRQKPTRPVQIVVAGSLPRNLEDRQLGNADVSRQGCLGCCR